MEHSHVSPSGASRWMKCPASVTLTEGVPGTTSVFAQEGQLAHKLAEWALSDMDFALESCLYMPHWENEEIKVNVEMINHVENYVNLIMSYVENSISPFDDFRNVQLYVEKMVPLGWMTPGMFGTMDAGVYINSEKRLRCWDLKYGRGVTVSPEFNPQQIIYALGLIGQNNPKGIKLVDLVIYQPRGQGLPEKVWETTYDDIYTYYLENIRPALARIEKGSTLQVPGKHCQFCKRIGQCSAVAGSALGFRDEATLQLPEPAALNHDQIAKVIDFQKLLTPWVDNVKKYAIDLIKRGAEIPGYKLVHTRPKRQWKDVKGLEEKFNKHPDLYSPQKIKTPAQVEKIFGKESVAEFWDKPAPGLSIAPADDSRKPVDLADEFSIIKKGE